MTTSYCSVKGIAPAIDNPRSEVAETISLRRRKGTVLVMEQLARDVTGWGAHALEMFQVLADTQYMNHIRPRNDYAPDLRAITGGQGEYSMDLARYEEVPGHVAQQVVQEAQREKEAVEA